VTYCPTVIPTSTPTPTPTVAPLVELSILSYTTFNVPSGMIGTPDPGYSSLFGTVGVVANLRKEMVTKVGSLATLNQLIVQAQTDSVLREKLVNIYFGAISPSNTLKLSIPFASLIQNNEFTNVLVILPSKLFFMANVYFPEDQYTVYGNDKPELFVVGGNLNLPTRNIFKIDPVMEKVVPSAVFPSYGVGALPYASTLPTVTAKKDFTGTCHYPTNLGPGVVDDEDLVINKGTQYTVFFETTTGLSYSCTP
jgi:hypothetical protein